MSDRETIVRAVFARAKRVGKSVYGYSSAKPAELRKAVKDAPADWDRICVEGDARWTALPVKEAQKG